MTRPTSDPSLTTEEREFYAKALEKASAGPASTGYGRPINQQVRFESFWRHNLYGGNYSLLDIGCGTGDLLNDVLKMAAAHVPGRYVGYDRDERMIDVAQKRFSNVQHDQLFDHDFLVGDAVTARIDYGVDKFDVVACIATLALKPKDWDQKAVYDYVKNQIECMADLSRDLVYVTLFSNWKNEIVPDEMVVSPSHMLEWALSNWDRVQIDHSYAPHDFALVIHKDEGSWWRDYRGR